MSMFDGEHLAHLSKRLRSSSAVVPALILSAIALPTGATGLIFGDIEVRNVFSWIILSPVVLVVVQIGFFTLFDRDRLQNEEHLEKRMLLRKLNPELGDANSVIEMPSNQTLIQNPSAGEIG